MNRRGKPNLLIVTSSFPRSARDETCGYVREFARRLAVDFNVRVIAPPDPSATPWPRDAFDLTRSKSPLPYRLNAFRSASDLNDLLRAGLMTRIVSFVAIVLFLIEAFRHARTSDVICSHWMVPSGLAGALASVFFGKPHVVVEHSGALHLLAGTPCGRMIARFIVRHSSKVITVSSGLRRVLIDMAPAAEHKTDVITMGYQLEEAGNAPGLRSVSAERPITALFLGRLTEIKGVELLLDALRNMDDVRLIVAGEGRMRTALEMRAAGLSTKPSFLGRVGAEERAALLAGCDFVVIPSIVLPGGRAEGTPVVCLESLAAGLPVIASRSGGLADAIVDGFNGLLFEPGNCKELTSAIRRLIDDHLLRNRLSANARLTAREYDWEAISNKYSRSIMSALG